MKRILSGVLAGLMLFSSVCTADFAAHAAEAIKAEVVKTVSDIATGTCGENATWTIKPYSYKLYIDGTGDMYDYGLEDAPWAEYREVIKGIVIGDEIITIGENAFRDCVATTSIELGANVVEIGAHAFAGCSSFDYYITSEKLERVMEGAFENCVEMTGFRFPIPLSYVAPDAFRGCVKFNCHRMSTGNTHYKIVDGVVYSADGKELLFFPAGDYMQRKNYEILEGATSISEYAFNSARFVETVTIPSTVTSIGDYAFYGSKALSSITIPAGVTAIGAQVGGNSPTLEFIENQSSVIMQLPTNENSKWTSESGNIITTLGTGKAYQHGIVVDIVMPETMSLLVSEEVNIVESYTFADENMVKNPSSMIYTSSNPAVATISEEGVVEALSAGTTTISARSRYGETTASCVLTVSENRVIQNDATGIPDANLYYWAVRKGDSNNDGKLTLTEAKAITDFQVSNADIVDITGLRYMENLEVLVLWNTTDEGWGDGWNKIEDISELVYLDKLEMLNLVGSRVSDISPLAEMEGLRYIDLSDNKVSDLSPLKDATWIQHLILPNNQITDIRALENHTGLYSLNINDNQVSDISAIRNCTLLAGLQIKNNKVSDISALANMTELGDLYLAGNPITDISVFADKTSITGIDLSNTLVSDISPIQNLTQMRGLFLVDCPVTDFSAIAGLTNISRLKLIGMDITDISFLSELVNLEMLYLSDNKITDVTPLQNMSELEQLYLDHNKITDLTGLEKLVRLETVDLSYNPLENTDPLFKGSNRLKKVYLRYCGFTDVSFDMFGTNAYLILDLSGNQLTDLSNFASGNFDWYYLQKLYLSDNKISDISIFEEHEFPSLQIIDLSNNKIMDISPLQAIDHWFDVNLDGNPFQDYEGWFQSDGKWYYISDGKYQTGWLKDNGKWYYLDNIGVMQTGWLKVNKNWYYINTDGVMHTGWKKDGGAWYYLNSDGIMHTGWKQINGIWYYFNTDGKMHTSWKQINGTWYYLNADGDMHISWKKINNKWYYFKTDGGMQTGWKKLNNVWYYFNADGDMCTGWGKVRDEWYYFDAEGAMQTGWKKLDGSWYYLDSDGVMKTGWLKDAGSWYFLNHNGKMFTGLQKINGKWYYMNTSGIMQTGWIKQNALWYHFNSDGAWDNQSDFTSSQMPSHSHSYGSKVTTESTCAQTGVMTYTCACGECYTKSIEKKAHTPSDWVITKEATCATTGTMEKICTECGAVVGTDTIATNDSHSYVWDVNETGNTRNHVCTECGDCHLTEYKYGNRWGYFDYAMAQEVWEYVNKQRNATQAGITDEMGNPIGTVMVPSLIKDGELSSLARARVVEIMDKFEMEGQELISRGYESSEAIYEAWCLNSTTLSAMVDMDYVYGGIAVFMWDWMDDGETFYGYCVLELGYE